MLTGVTRSLRDLLGDDYLDAVVRTRHALTGAPLAELEALASEPVEFFPEAFAERCRHLVARVGTVIVEGLPDPVVGAPSGAFGRAQNQAAAPLGGLGPCRVGQDGRVYLAAKSEHYQASLGHAFPGFRLIALARELGILNATHNNTRGQVTRIAERALVAAAAGLDPADRGPAVDELVAATGRHVLNRVVNLETGSLAAEAALKMMLTRFYAADGGAAVHEGVTPVLLVLADGGGGPTANYHGTTVTAQLLRGMWPGLRSRLEEAGVLRVVAVPPNDIAAFEDALARHSTGGFRVAGFCHEIILMNYGGLRLDEAYLRAAYDACDRLGVPVFCDEIQSGAWYPELFLFRRYGIRPDMVAVGKGFPGGEYPASRILLSAEFDGLSQFGALVTNGQEELASLAYLVTMTYVHANGAHIDDVGAYLHAGLGQLVGRYPGILSGVAGDGLMAGVQFVDGAAAARFCRALDRDHGIDTSVQAYKPATPPVALLKLPVVVERDAVDVLLDRMGQVLDAIAGDAR